MNPRILSVAATLMALVATAVSAQAPASQAFDLLVDSGKLTATLPGKVITR